MPTTWFFNMNGNTVEMIARAEGEDGTVGDAFSTVGPNDRPIYPKGLTYAALAAVGSGTLEEFDDGSFKITGSPVNVAKEEDETDTSGVTDDDLKRLFSPEMLASAKGN